MDNRIQNWNNQLWILHICRTWVFVFVLEFHECIIITYTGKITPLWFFDNNNIILEKEVKELKEKMNENYVDLG